MRELFVLRRANGQLFAERMSDRLRIPVWSSANFVARHLECNPKPLVLPPACPGCPPLDRTSNVPAREAQPEFFLLADDALAAELGEGRPLALQENFLQAASKFLQA